MTGSVCVQANMCVQHKGVLELACVGVRPMCNNMTVGKNVLTSTYH